MDPCSDFSRLDPDPGGQKNQQKKLKKCIVLLYCSVARTSFIEASGEINCNLSKHMKNFFNCKILQFFAIKYLDPDPL